MRVVISQSMLFPWVGLLEQVRLADVFVHYDDVQFSKGSFVNRVQIKTADGVRWMTIPVRQHRLGQPIDDVEVGPTAGWRAKHLDLLERNFAGAPHAADALALVRDVYAHDYPSLGAVARASMLAVIDYFGLRAGRRFLDVTETGIGGRSTDRVLDVVRHVGGSDYITGHGAANYLDHERFVQHGISVSYINYRCVPYPQLHGAFTPYVSSLDLIANLGRDGVQQICSDTVDWREFLARRKAASE
jgi:hypothetical protein